ncbi:MotA/TolQ/ExbB proton channel family protein [Myxococcota bacterium]|nr:MotA/TolQ/ExbB proton channel family protein [Myxococcota bacterium]MBU1537815.1 MotA/TolQ/ExbB proton channel family protein [Myxococcota bacterium]
MEIFSLLAKGGLLIYPILAASLLGSVIVIERFIALRRERINPNGLKKRIEGLVKKGKKEEALKVLRGYETPLSALLTVAVENLHLDRRSLVELLEEKGRTEVHYMGRGIEFVGVLAAVAPLLGLLGTVTGMISVFQDVTRQATVRGVNPANLASGIWEALITTAAGLAVAIPLYILYRYLASRVDTLVVELEEEVLTAVKTMQSSGPE